MGQYGDLEFDGRHRLAAQETGVRPVLALREERPQRIDDGQQLYQESNFNPTPTVTQHPT
jgi:hypothetical protein